VSNEERELRVLMVASEAAPFAKSGGLADVIGALPAALQSLGNEVGVVLPRYTGIHLDGVPRAYEDLRVWLGPTEYRADVYLVTEGGVSFYFVDCPSLYDRDGLYGDTEGDFPDNHVRYAFFARVALRLARHVFRPDVIHCHDWQSGLVPAYLRSTFALDPTFLRLKTVFTIHNLAYQGLFPKTVLPEIALPASVFHPEGLEFFGKVSFLKAGLAFSDALTTVSRTYAREIQTPEYGFGLDGFLRSRSSVLTGIQNGVDYSDWDPATDKYIAANYSAGNLSGKRECKRDLLAELGLPQEAMDRPLIGIVSRFTRQKGFDLVAEISPDLAADNLCLAALGTGEPEYEKLLLDMATKYPKKMAVRIAYDNRIAHKIEAGADIFLMPSRWEPSGLNQIYSLRYGTVPVVRATGGLDDTIDEGTGFKFKEYSGRALLLALRSALAAFRRKPVWTAMIERGMRKDFSWRVSATEYEGLYKRLTG
jgi:starch synthase